MLSCWTALTSHQLTSIRISDDDPAASMVALLDQWSAHLHKLATEDPGETNATLTWPSRDAAMTTTFLAHGLAPTTAVAVRPAGRRVPDRTDTDVRVRPYDVRDAAAVAALWLEEVHWDAQFGGATVRDSTPERLREQVAEFAAGTRPECLIAERGGTIVGIVVLEWPEDAGWISSMVASDSARTAYISCMSVRADGRSAGVGSALAASAHELLEEAGVEMTVLHYSALNPLSVPFWHRSGYRPLWTAWETRPHTTLRG
jgi:GNAT superfamily N-acetyltransferase